MIVQTEEDIKGLQEIGRIVALTIQEMKKHAKPGITTRELDEIGRRVMEGEGAVSAPKKVYDFPGYTCISINREVAHGIPGDRVMEPGDLVNVDVCAEKGGYFADAGHSFQLEPVNPDLTRLCDHTHATMMKVIMSLKHGTRLNEIGRIIEEEAAKGGYQVIQNLCSHGVGRSIHESPSEILPTYNKHDKRRLKEGMVITIEPFLSTGTNYVLEQPDGWTLSVPDESFVAQHEHTLIITQDKPIIVTVV
ncbi:type I methionyl aminopeptidase [Paenibacillus sambharensis]|uniref:Methionine aminopeptidase n=1 Tax=Paenibacillus sambharensis TaxID=1803190 RepID=A0A2W1L742_9BACL|nr:type I methionyl aminopeptidase [Paenibacillus sambharensis]PZD94773.1 type I methionyl aminopeptidase [Paenibacillus sambharensis]